VLVPIDDQLISLKISHWAFKVYGHTPLRVFGGSNLESASGERARPFCFREDPSTAQFSRILPGLPRLRLSTQRPDASLSDFSTSSYPHLRKYLLRSSSITRLYRLRFYLIDSASHYVSTFRPISLFNESCEAFHVLAA
jgi:hypothetical protein